MTNDKNRHNTMSCNHSRCAQATLAATRHTNRHTHTDSDETRGTCKAELVECLPSTGLQQLTHNAVRLFEITFDDHNAPSITCQNSRQ